jgi:hypothetical protein
MDLIHIREDVHVCFDAAEQEAIRRQLERMLASPLFKFSKRYPNLLRYVVEHTLEGSGGELKERTLGVAVFGREPDYDTNVDPVVRATAGEIRKRIAQYYHEPGHAHELRIDLSPRSYIPEFEFPPPLTPPTVMVRPPELPATPARLPRYTAAAAGVVLLAAAIFWFRPWGRQSDLDRFWKPVLDSSDTVLMCAGQREFLGSSPEPGQVGADLPGAFSGPVTLFQLYYMGSQNLSLPVVGSTARLAGILEAKGKSIQIRGQLSTDFAALRNGPVILVGAFDNNWTMRLTGPLPYSFERDHDTFWIKDRQNPSRRDRAVNYRTPYLDLTEDYALLSRTLDPTTGRMVVVIGGLTGYGTMAAGEFLTDPSYFAALAKVAPKGWERKNIQLVLATQVIRGSSGPPRVLERQFW